MKYVQDVMTKNILWATTESSLFEVAKLMIRGRCGEIPLVKNKNDLELVGVITDRDIVCRTLGVGENPAYLKAGDCMTSGVVTGELDMSIDDCIDIMEENQIRRLPIINEEGKLCGIISRADLAGEIGESETIEMLEKISPPSDFAH